MDVIIIGAGNVGYTIAEALSRIHNVTMVDLDEKKVTDVQESLNVGTLQANGASPVVLQKIITKSTSMLLAVTQSDETNMFSCMAAKAIKPDIQTVARIRDHEYIFKTEPSGAYLGADHIISPELLTAEKMARIALLENAVDYEELEAMGLMVVTFMVKKEHTSVLGEAVINLNLPDLASIVAIYRGDDVIVLNESTHLREGDLVCVMGKKEGIEQFNRMMGMVREAKDFVILGGGIIGRRIAKLLEKEKSYVRLLERDENKCHALSREFDHVLVINANAVDPRALRAENVGAADVLISATNSDEKNLLACLVARQLGIQKVISRYSRREYEDVFAMTRIHGAIGYHRVVANEITKRMISDENAILQMRHPKELFFSINLNEKSGLAMTPVGDLKMPEGSRIVVIMRDGEAIFPRLNTPLMVGDKLLIFAYEVKMSKLEKMFHTVIEASI